MEPITDVRDISRIAYGYMASRALFAALDLDLFTRLSGIRKATESLARETGVSVNLLQPLLTSLVSVGLVVINEGQYSNAPACEAYLVRGSTRDFSDYLRYVVGKVNYSFMSELEPALSGKRKPLKKATTVLGTLIRRRLSSSRALNTVVPWDLRHCLRDIPILVVDNHYSTSVAVVAHFQFPCVNAIRH
jgi:hypothetical protein